MRKWVIVLLAAAIAASGCEGGATSGKQTVIPKTFFDRTISYTVEPAAKEHMTRLETLLRKTKDTDEPLTDDELLPLYRDADLDRDHHIKAAEAEAYYREYILRFEDALGSIRVRTPRPEPQEF